MFSPRETRYVLAVNLLPTGIIMCHSLVLGRSHVSHFCLLPRVTILFPYLQQFPPSVLSRVRILIHWQITFSSNPHHSNTPRPVATVSTLQPDERNFPFTPLQCQCILSSTIATYNNVNLYLLPHHTHTKTHKIQYYIRLSFVCSFVDIWILSSSI